MIEDLLTPLVCQRYLTDVHYREWYLHVLHPKPGTIVLGLHMPEVKHIAKNLSKKKCWHNLLHDFSVASAALSHDERMVWGLMLNYVDCSLEERLCLIDAFLPAVDNWAICDNFCCNAKWIEKSDKQQVWHWIYQQMKVTAEFQRRVPIVLAMNHYLGPDTMDITLQAISNMNLREGEPYYVQMAVAWLLATALAKDGATTRAFVNAARLPNDIVKRYIRKARESRITKTIAPL